MTSGLLVSLRQAWAKRDLGVHEPVLIVFDPTDPLGAELADVFDLAPDAGGPVVVLAPAHVVRKILNLVAPTLVDDVRPGEHGPAIVVYLRAGFAAAVPLDAIRNAANEPTTQEDEPMASKGTSRVVQAVQESVAPVKPKRKKKVRRTRFGEGKFGFSTKIPVARSREQIEQMLQRYQCDQFGWMTDSRTNRTTIQFRCRDRMIRFQLELPRQEEFEVTQRCFKRGVRKLPAEHAAMRHEKAVRARWRAITQGIKAKLILVDYGISQFEDAFLAETIDPTSGKTVGTLIREGALLPALAPAPRMPALNGSAHHEVTAG
jgi:hypothetical protein